MNERTITLGGSLGHGHMDSVLSGLQPCFELSEPCRLTIDLSGVTFIRPTPFVILQAALRHMEESETMAEGSRLIPPSREGVFDYMRRMDLFGGIDVDGPPEEFRRHNPVGFRPCARFSEFQEGRDQGQEAIRSLEESGLQLDTGLAAALTVCFDELTQNVVTHAESPIGGVIMAQATPATGWSEIAIVDLGVGIPSRLTSHSKYEEITDDVEAIERALELYVTSNPGPENSGYGLTVAATFLRHNRGLMVVRSGSGVVLTGGHRDSRVAPVRMPGTLLTFRVRLDGPSDIGAVYEELFPGGAHGI